MPSPLVLAGLTSIIERFGLRAASRSLVETTEGIAPRALPGAAAESSQPAGRGATPPGVSLLRPFISAAEAAMQPIGRRISQLTGQQTAAATVPGGQIPRPTPAPTGEAFGPQMPRPTPAAVPQEQPRARWLAPPRQPAGAAEQGGERAGLSPFLRASQQATETLGGRLSRLFTLPAPPGEPASQSGSRRGGVVEAQPVERPSIRDPRGQTEQGGYIPLSTISRSVRNQEIDRDYQLAVGRQEPTREIPGSYGDLMQPRPLSEASRSIVGTEAFQSLRASAMSRVQESGIESEEKRQKAEQDAQNAIKKTSTALSVMGLNVVSVSVAMASMPNIIAKLSRAQVEQLRTLEMYGGQIAVASAAFEAGEIGRKVELAQGLGGSSARLFASQTRLEETLLPQKGIWTFLMNSVQTALNDLVNIGFAINGTTFVMDAIWDLIRNLDAGAGRDFSHWLTEFSQTNLRTPPSPRRRLPPGAVVPPVPPRGGKPRGPVP